MLTRARADCTCQTWQSMAMGNAIKWLKMRVGHTPPHLPNHQAKEMLCTQAALRNHHGHAVIATMVAL